MPETGGQLGRTFDMTTGRFLLAALACSSAAMVAGGALAEPTEKWCSGVTIAAFPGGPQGGVFANNVYNGFRQAELDLGPTVTYYFSNWDPNLMLQQIQQAVATGVDGRLYAITHLGWLDESLARTMAAALGGDLIFEVEPRGASPLQLLHRAADAKRRAKAGVGVDQQRQLVPAGDPSRLFANLAETGDAEIGEAERGVGDAGARKVEGAKARPLRQ